MTVRPAYDHARLVHAIYDGADDPSGFGPTIRRVADAIDAQKAHLIVLEGGVSVVESEVCGGNGSEDATYRERWQAVDPRFALGVARPGEILSDVEHLDQEAFLRSPIYNELLAREDVRYSLVGILEVGPDLTLAQAYMRAASSGPFDGEDLARLTDLTSHVRRAMRVRHVVRVAERDRGDLGRALDLVPSPVAIVDGRGKIVCANGEAEGLLGRAHGVRVAGGILTSSRAAEAGAIAAAITRTAAIADAGSGRRVVDAGPSVAIRREGRAPLSLAFLPLRSGNPMRGPQCRTARVLVLVHDPERAARLDPVLLRGLHGFTAAEADLAVTLAEGKSLREFAAARGCGHETARTHLKRALEKTGTHRQAELVSRVLTTSALRPLA